MSLTSRAKEYFGARARTWGLTVPIHVFAFVALFVGALRLSESAYLEAGSEIAKLYLRQVVNELAVMSEDQPEHALQHLLEGHRWMSLRLFDLEGRPVVLLPEPGERPAGLDDFLASQTRERFELDSSGGRKTLRGLARVAADERCLDCHEPNRPLAIASMQIDLTGELSGVHAQLRRNLGVLILVWAALVGLSTALVRRSAQRYADRLAAGLEDTAASETSALEARSGLILDPVTKQLQQSIRDFLRERKRREAEVADRMAHSDQLASLGRLAAGLAHEIKNPLAGIQGALQILGEDLPEGDRNRELCGQMLEELDRVNQTLQLLLSSARPTTPHLAETDVRELLGRAIRLVEPAVRGREIRVQLEVAEGPLRFRLDAAKMHQVLVNIVGNAVDAFEGGGTVTVRASKLASDGGLAISVEDDGPGIGREKLARVFEPFFTTKFGGTGLGLAIARSLVEQHGGTLEVDSEEGRGARFLIILPDDSGAGEPSPGEGAVR